MSSTRSRDPREPVTKADWSRSALVLCAHGVEGEVGSAGDHVARLRASGLFSAVSACCLHGAPRLADAIAATTQQRVYVVPFLMSEGYTARIVLPRQVSRLDLRERDVVVCRPVGTSEKLLEVVEGRVAAACQSAGWPLRESVLAIASHGTARHPRSGATAHRLAARFRHRKLFKGVETGFLAQEPSVASVIHRHQQDRVVAVGLFADEGPHGRADMERLLAPAGRNAIYGGPIGPAPEMATAILDRVRDSRHQAPAGQSMAP